MKTCKFLILLLIGISFIFYGCDDDENEHNDLTNPSDMPYNLVIIPSNFEDVNITGNNYFPLIPGTTFSYEGEDEDGAVILVEEYVTDSTKVIMGVTCVVMENTEWEDGVLVEDTDDWYAQDLNGNVWYFGEFVENYDDGVFEDNDGSWEAGVDGALPGIIMFAEPYIGVWYRQEYYEGEAEDVALVLSLTETVTVPYGTFTDCLQVAEWNPLEPGVVEHKFYAPGIGLLRSVAVEGEVGYEDLVNIENQ